MHTALLLVDPYNDFLSAGGKFWPLIRDIAEATGTIANLRMITAAVRTAGMPVFVVPHHRWEPGDLDGWDHPTPYQLQSGVAQSFARGAWGGEWHPDFAPRAEDVVAREHWTSNGFANTDLDFLLKQRKITRVIVAGCLANTCIEGTARAAVDLGYHVTLVKDATAAFSLDAMHAAHEINAPSFAHAILTTPELIATLHTDEPELVLTGARP
jgi:nicotinamidase-related amidase